MIAPTSPTASGRWLALKLRRLREDQGLAQKAASNECGWSGARLSYLENAQQHVVDGDLDKLLSLYQVPEKARRPYYEAAQHSRTRGWWEDFEPPIPDWLSRFIGLEQGAVEIRSFLPLVLPGLLQTPAYAAAVIQGDEKRRIQREVDRLVNLRTTRQRILTRPDAPTTLRTVVDEGVLSRSPDDPEVMLDQLEHLVDMAQRPTIEVRILPSVRGIQSLTPGPFVILTLPWEDLDSEVVYIEYRGGAMYLEGNKDVDSHDLAFESLLEHSLSENDSLEVIKQAIERNKRR